MAATTSSPRLLWQPLPDSGRNLKALIHEINHDHKTKLQSYRDLWNWSVDPATAPRFWLALYKFLRIKADTTPQFSIEKKPVGNAQNRKEESESNSAC